MLEAIQNIFGGQSVKSRWSKLNQDKTPLLFKAFRYSELTIPSVCPKDSNILRQEALPIHSIGAQAVNSLVNKMMLVMFSPSRPFMRFDMDVKKKAEILSSLRVSETQLQESLSQLEKACIREIDSVHARPKLYDLLMQLIVTGNAVKHTKDDAFKIYNLNNFVSKRGSNGHLIELILKSSVSVQDLPEELSPFVTNHQEDENLDYYIWFRYNNIDNKYYETHYIKDVLITLPAYIGKYTEDTMPASHHVWRLTDGNDYGTGHVEDFIGDLEGLDQLLKAEVDGAILSSEFRWLANPAGMTKVEDVKTSKSGDTLPGVNGDLNLVSATGVSNTIQVVSACADKYIKRIYQGFLMTAGIQRNAERVTAEEIRVLANELETGLGGIYSRLSIDLQLPIAKWLMNRVIGSFFTKSDFYPVIITGLDALSRNQDLENTRLFLADVAQIISLPENVLMYLKIDNILSSLAAGRGLSSTQLINSQQEVDEKLEIIQQQNLKMLEAEQAAKVKSQMQLQNISDQ